MSEKLANPIIGVGKRRFSPFTTKEATIFEKDYKQNTSPAVRQGM
ncbi:UNVERIFIED_CONTAM: hypothetical protein ABIC26_002916 [Paenibacillus sp. PvR008]